MSARRHGETSGEIAGRFRKKPVVVEAVQWLPNDAQAVDRLISWLSDEQADWYVDEDSSRLCIRTLEGRMFAKNGDWIICGVQGEFYRYKPDTFEATYEPADG